MQQPAINRHLKNATIGCDQPYISLQTAFKQGCQTGSPWLVVSNRTIFDLDLHGETTPFQERTGG